MNTINFTKYDRFPIDKQMLAFFQAKVDFLQELTALGSGDGNYIVSGCTENGNNIASGIVCINNEILPFEGGAKADTVVISETSTDVQAEGQNFEGIYVERYARFGSGVGEVQWSDLKPLPTLNDMKNMFNDLGDKVLAHLKDENNPHKDTKESIGLGNLPNAKSDAINLNDSNTLATSKAVADVAKQITANNKILASGKIAVNTGSIMDNLSVLIPHNLGHKNYTVFATFVYQETTWSPPFNYGYMVWYTENLKKENEITVKVKHTYGGTYVIGSNLPQPTNYKGYLEYVIFSI